MADAESQLSFLVQPSGSIQPLSGADELSVTTQMKLEMCVRAQEGIPMVTALEVGQLCDMDSNRPSLILCRSQGDTLWNIAKRCGSTVDDIMRINHLEGQPQQNQMILIPVS